MGGLGCVRPEFVFDCDDQGGEVAVADYASELLFASSMPAAVERIAISPELQRLTLRLVRRNRISTQLHQTLVTPGRRAPGIKVGK